MEHNLSRVRSIPWKLVSTLRPCTSSAISLNLRKVTSSFWRSARETSNTRPFSPSEAIPKKRKTFSSLSSLGRWSCHFRNEYYATMGKTMPKLLKSLHSGHFNACHFKICAEALKDQNRQWQLLQLKSFLLTCCHKLIDRTKLLVHKLKL